MALDHVDADGNTDGRPAVAGVKGARILIVEARYYADIADALIAGAEREIGKNGALSSASSCPAPSRSRAPSRWPPSHYDGFVALGCVIRGETTHYDYVCGESARGLMDLAIHKQSRDRLRHPDSGQRWTRPGRAPAIAGQGRRRGARLPRHDRADAAGGIRERKPKPRPAASPAGRATGGRAGALPMAGGPGRACRDHRAVPEGRTGEAGDGGMRRKPTSRFQGRGRGHRRTQRRARPDGDRSAAGGGLDG